MSFNWFLNKDVETGNVYVFICGVRARCMKSQEILDAVQQIDFGRNDDEIKVIKISAVISLF